MLSVLLASYGVALFNLGRIHDQAMEKQPRSLAFNTDWAMIL